MSAADLQIPDELRAAQQRASDPAVSVWVGAHAGSGKTTVLVRRVIRLLLAGGDPARILCLTFTKAAAANMQNRLFAELSRWVALEDQQLAQEITAISGRAPDARGLREARRLFARAVETPGGLKLQTIHALCERLLHLFPFEAGVPANFTVLDETAAEDLLGQVQRAVLRQAEAEPDTPLGAALNLVAEAKRDGDIAPLVRSLWTLRGGMLGEAAPERKFAGSPLRQLLGVTPMDTAEACLEALWRDRLDDGTLARLVHAITNAGTAKEKAELLPALQTIMAGAGDQPRDVYKTIFLTANNAPRKQIVTKAVVAAAPNLLAALEREQERVAACVTRATACMIAERTQALETLADAMASAYRDAKARRAALDFGDLITHVRAMLERIGSGWVLHKLDRGIDHILVDEAQDTSPAQWAIIARLVDDFFTGEGARGALLRTIFAVGDEKQSIYGFQGADPRGFAEHRDRYERAARAGGRAFARVPLRYSFRTVETVLQTVDATFDGDDQRRGLADEPIDPHLALRRLAGSQAPAPGRVELWPPVQVAAVVEPDPESPVDAMAEQAAPAVLARRIAQAVRDWCDHEHLDADGRAITPGDVLILVQKRGPLFDALQRALRDEGLPVAGADRLKLGEHIAVLDLLALAQACCQPEDDLALASVLKSPLFGLTDEDLLALTEAPDDAPLHLRLAASPTPAHRDAHSHLTAWRALARRCAPSRFFADVLTLGEGRARLLARLSPDAADAIDAFLALVERWEVENPPALTALVEAMRGLDAEQKRELEEAHGRVRVMTVHSAKGLEAPIVILADATAADPRLDGTLLNLAEDGDGEAIPVWAGTAKEGGIIPAIADARARTRERLQEERRRLLYVAMTRARDRLIVAGHLSANAEGPPKGCWWLAVEQALQRLGAEPHPTLEGGLQLGPGARAPLKPRAAAPAPGAVALPAWWGQPPPASSASTPPLAPSSLVAAEPPTRRPPTAARQEARARGQLMHRLVEVLAGVEPARRADVARRLAAHHGAGLSAETIEGAIDAAVTLLADPTLAPLFGTEAMAEVPIHGRLTIGGKEREIAGRIDRLVVLPDRVLLADIKTGHPAPGAPEPATLAQLAAYAALLRDIWPDHSLEAWLIWSQGPVAQPVSRETLDAALATISG